LEYSGLGIVRFFLHQVQVAGEGLDILTVRPTVISIGRSTLSI